MSVVTPNVASRTRRSAGQPAAQPAASSQRITRMEVSLLIAALLAPFVLEPHPQLVTLATSILILSLLAISFDLCWGYAGIMSFGQALFFGVGAYATAVLGRDYSFSQWWGVLPLAALAGAAAAALLAAFLLLGRRPPTPVFVALGTLTGAYAAERLVSGWNYLGAGNGISSVKLLAAGKYEFAEGAPFYFLALATLAVFYLGARWVARSQFGLVLAGMRQNEERLAFFGYRTQVFKALVFSFAGAMAGIAGALYTCHQGFVGPANLGPALSTTAVLYCLLGGSATLLGPVLGVILTEALSHFLGEQPALREYWQVVLGAVLLAVVMFKPSGLLGLVVSARERVGAYGAGNRG